MANTIGGKGTISPGSDADIAIFDPTIRRILRAKDLETPAGWSPYEGLEVRGWLTCVISRGDIIVQDGELHAEPGRGRFLKRKLREQFGRRSEGLRKATAIRS